MGCQTRTNLVNDENGNVLEDSYNILSKNENYVFQLLNVYGNHDIREIEINTVNSLVRVSSSFEDGLLSIIWRGVNP
jgi:hypothetical protein